MKNSKSKPTIIQKKNGNLRIGNYYKLVFINKNQVLRCIVTFYNKTFIGVFKL